jgi:hypothetical protein
MNRNLNDRDPYHIYLDLNCINNDQSGKASPPNLVFNEVRNSPILMNPSDYFLSVVRFTIQTPSLPMFVPVIKTGQSNPNLTVYKVGMSFEYSGTTYTQSTSVIFVPENLNEPVPDAPTTSQDFSTTYYYINSINSFVQMVNVALASCLSSLNTTVTGAGGTLPSTVPPFLELDPFTNTCILNADEVGFNDDDAPTAYVKIFFNTALYNLFGSFQAEFNGFNQTNDFNYRLRVYDDYAMNIFNVSTSPLLNYLQMYQGYATLNAMCNPVQSLVFSTGLIPVNPSLISAPLVFAGDGNVNSSANNDNIQPVLTDFEVPVDANDTYKPFIHYVPTAEYRLKDLLGNNPLSAVQMSVFFKTQFGNLVPFKLSAGCSANLKLLFRRKEFDVAIPKFSK